MNDKNTVVSMKGWSSSLGTNSATKTGQLTIPEGRKLSSMSEDEFKNLIRDEMYLLMYSQNADPIIDSFDALYLADLEPDAISFKDIDELKKYSSLEDWSGEISFDDEWDD